MSDQLLMLDFVANSKVQLLKWPTAVSTNRICDKMLFLLFIYAQSIYVRNQFKKEKQPVTWLNFLLKISDLFTETSLVFQCAGASARTHECAQHKIVQYFMYDK